MNPPMTACLAMLSATAGLAGAAPTGLEQALAKMATGNHTLHAQARKAETATEQKLAARGNFLPVVRLDVVRQL